MKKFSDKAVQHLPSRDKAYDLREGEGFGIRVFPSGQKTWFFLYRIHGKRCFLNLGSYPAVSLAEARIKHKSAALLLSRGINPLAVEVEQKEAIRSAPTVKDLADDFLAKHVSNKAPRAAANDRYALYRDVVPAWGSRKAREIRRKDAIALLEKVAARAKGQVPNTLKVCKKMWNWAIDREICEVNPFLRIDLPGCKPKSRDRTLSEEEISQLWKRVTTEEAPGTSEIRRALLLILVTAQRPGEVAGMHRREIDGHWWTIPAERVKSNRSQRVYLTDLALEVIGDKDGYIFPSPRKGPLDSEQSITVNAISYHVRRELPDQKKAFYGLPRWTPHDLRRTARTFFASLGVASNVAEAMLNHSLKGVEAIYNRYSYDEEKKAAWKLWEQKLREIVRGETPGSKNTASEPPDSPQNAPGSKGKVIPFPRPQKAA